MNILSPQPLLPSIQPPPLALYVHVPYCIKKCPYCDFNSHPLHEDLPEKAYINALINDLESQLPKVWNRPIVSIFIGGGTPSLLSANAVDWLLRALRARLPVEPDAEITMEANPGTFERQRFVAYRQAGINRLSLGIQSFHNQHLRALGRIHNGLEALHALETALEIFPKVNVDLMYALPNQSVAEAVDDMTLAIENGVTHISAYQLTLEANTAFGHTPPPHMPNEDQLMQIEEAVHQRLTEAGFEHYEISAFCRQHAYGNHNLNYWQFGDYLGIGAGAHGKISTMDQVIRSVKPSHPNAYLRAYEHSNRDHPDEYHVVPRADLPFEFMMNALRLTAGVPMHFFIERTGLSLSAIIPALEQANQKGWLVNDPLHLTATDLGQRYLNDVLTLFLPHDN